MEEKTESELILWFTIIYLSIFTLLAIIQHNYEFIYYTIILSVLILIITLYHKKMHLGMHIMLGLSLLGLMHILGGNIYIKGIRLYDMWLIPNIFRYDMLVHSLGSFIATFVIYSLINPHLDKKIEHNYILLSLILISCASGLGAFNEILELGGVLYLGATKQVGDYFNNAFDLVFNLVGSIIACFIIIEYHKLKKEK